MLCGSVRCLAAVVLALQLVLSSAAEVGRAGMPSACNGAGSRSLSQISKLSEDELVSVAKPARPLTLSATVLLRIYRSFTDRALRAFPGASILVDQSRRTEFDSEAERWLFGFGRESMNGTQIATTAPTAVANTSLDSNASMSNETAANATSSGVVTALGGVVRSCLGLLHQTFMSVVDARPPSFTYQPPMPTWNGYVLLSGSDRNAALADRVVANHAAFARQNHYVYWWFRGSLVASAKMRPYWHKVAMLRLARDRFPAARGFIWIDDDIVLTNLVGTDMLRAAFRSSNASVLVTRDAANFATLNTGIILVRANDAGRETLEELWRRAFAPRDDGVSLAFDSQSKCLHEQQALQEMIQQSPWDARVAVLDQRGSTLATAPREPSQAHLSDAPGARVTGWNLNTFLRWSHYSSEREEQMRFDADRPGSGWVRGDFAGHCSGLSPARRALCVAVLLGSVMS